MKRLKFTAEEIDNRLDLVKTIKDAQTATGASVVQMQSVVDTVDKLAKGTDAAFKGFIAGSDLNLKTIDTSLATTKASLDALSGIKDWTAQQIEINKQQFDIALNDHKASIADHYATVAGVKTIETSLDLVNKALGSVDEITNTAGEVVGYQAESIKAVSDAGLAQAQAAKAYTDAQIEVTNSSVTAVKNIVDEIAEISESSGEIAHYQARGVQALNEAINAEGTGLAALKDAVDAAQDAANTNKTAFETFYKTDEKGEVLPGTVFGTFKTMVDEHNAAMDNTETGLTALHSAIGAVKGITDSQAKLIEDQSKLITGHKAILDDVRTIADNSKSFLDTHKTAIETCISTAEVGNRINNMHATVTNEIATAQKTVSDKVTKVGEEVTALGKDVAGIGNKVAQQMQIAFGEIVDPDTGEKRPNQLVADIKGLAKSANDHATEAEKASDEAKAKALEIEGITDKLNFETLPAITDQITAAEQKTTELKSKVDENINKLNSNYDTLNSNINRAQTDLSNMKKDLDGDENNPGILNTVKAAQGIIKDAQNDIEKAKTDIQDINTELTKKQEAITAAEDRLTTAEGTLNGLDDRFAEVNSNISDAQGKVDGLVKQLSGSDDPNATDEEKLGILGKVQAAEAAITKANKDIKDNKDALDADINKFKEQLNGKEGQPGLLAQVATAGEKVEKADKLLNGDESSKDPELQKGILVRVEEAQSDIAEANRQIGTNKQELTNSINDFKVQVNGTSKEGDPDETRLGLIGMANQAIKTANGKITEMEGSITTANNTLTTLGSRIEEVNNTLLPKINKLTGDAEQLAADNKKTAEDLTATAADIRANANIIKGVADKAAQDIADGNLHIAKGSISLGGTAQSPAFKVDESGKLLATSGKIAGFNIVGNELSSQTVSLNPTKGITLTLSSNQSDNEGLYITANETTASVKSLHDLRLTNDKLLVTNYSNSAGKIEGFTIESIKSDYPSISSSIVLNSDKNRRGIELFTINSDVTEHAELTVGPNSYRTDIVCSTGIFRDKDGPIDSKSLHSALQYSDGSGVVFKSGEISIANDHFKKIKAPSGVSDVLSISVTMNVYPYNTGTPNEQDNYGGYHQQLTGTWASGVYWKSPSSNDVYIANDSGTDAPISYLIIYKL